MPQVYAPRFRPPHAKGVDGELVHLKMVRMNKGPFVDAKYLEVANVQIGELEKKVRLLTAALEEQTRINETRELLEVALLKQAEAIINKKLGVEHALPEDTSQRSPVAVV